MISKIIKNTLPAIAILSIVACAKIGSPTGGPKDEDPPIVVGEKPSNYSTYFQSEKIEVEFDEFIQLKDVAKEFSVSPPFEKKPIPVVKGKKVVVEFKGEELDSTTYTFNFGNSISDFNEGNIIENYEFVFSLNSYVDSMSVAGTLLNAFDLKADKERLMVFLYNDTIDSIPYLQQPNYLANTDEEGNFQINNLPTGKYKIFALKDANNNLLYDLPNEAIAYSKNFVFLHPDSFKLPEPDPTFRIDTIIKIDSLFQNDTLFAIDTVIVFDTIAIADSISLDTVIVDPQPSSLKSKKGKSRKKKEAELLEKDILLEESDTAQADSVMQPLYLYTYALDMVFFVEEFENQYLKEFDRPRKEKLEFIFGEPVGRDYNIRPLSKSASDSWFLSEHGREGDTLKYWITDSSMYNKDSLYFELSYTMVDSSGDYFLQQDTLLLKHLTKKDKGKGRSRKPKKKDQALADSIVIPKLKVSNNMNQKALDLHKKIALESETPVFDFRPDSVFLYKMEDTLEVAQNINLFKDSTSLRKFYFDFVPEEIETYKLVMMPQTFTDIYGVYNDTLSYRFTAQRADFYGSIKLNITGIYDNTVLQVLNAKEEFVLAKTVTSDSEVLFEYMNPAKYLMKLFVDSNGNGKWDTGNYLEGIQPEKVIYYPGEIDVRSNWEMDITWDIHTKVQIPE